MKETLSSFAFGEMKFRESENTWGKILKQNHGELHYYSGMILVKSLWRLYTHLISQKMALKVSDEKKDEGGNC